MGESGSQFSIEAGYGSEYISGSGSAALQGAVDYVAGLGGGRVIIKSGVYLMSDSLHLRSNVEIVGEGEVVLKGSFGVCSELWDDGDFGEEKVTVKDPGGFRTGMGIAIADDRAQGFHTTVATIIGIEGDTLHLNAPLLADCMVDRGAMAWNTFPVISGYHVSGVSLKNLTVIGDKNGKTLNGCRGGGIFLYRAHGARILDCRVQEYPGDGISYQQSDDVTVERCTVAYNSELGLHPGSGSSRPVIRNCVSEGNGSTGLFLCWRVKNGLFTGNRILKNGFAGISIGHKDTDNVFEGNLIEGNRLYGVCFRNETEPMAGHRNSFASNRLVDNGTPESGSSVRIDGATNDITFKGNVVTESRFPDQMAAFSLSPAARGFVEEDNIYSGFAETIVIRSGV